MNLAAISVLASLFLQAPNARIEGRAIDGISGEPLGAAQVTLWVGSLGQQITTTSTDNQGRFAFPDIAASDYRVSIRKEGYAENAPFIQNLPGALLGTPVIFEPNQTIRNLEFKLWRESLVSGRVLGSNGQALADVELQLIREAFDATGTKTYAVSSVAGTNDRGEYRMHGVLPGQYYVRAGVPEIRGSAALVSMPDSSPATNYVTTFFPGVDSVSQATRLDIKAGMDLGRTDIVLKPRPSAKYKISGRIVDGRPAASRRGDIQYTFSPKNTDGRAGEMVYTPNPDGTFEIADVDPGEYIVTAQVQDPVARPATGARLPFHTLYASVPVQIVSGDVPDVVVTVVPVSLEGHLKIEGDAAPNARLQVRLKKYRGNSPLPASIKPDGSFSFEDLGIGSEYALSVSGLEPDMYIKDARLGTADLRYQLLQVTSAAMVPLDVVIGTNGGRMDGAVDAVQKTGAIVAIIPADRIRTDLYRSTTVDAQGRFSISGIAPGEYKVFAWNNPPQRYAFFDPEFLRPFEASGKTINVSVGGVVTVQLTLLTD